MASSNNYVVGKGRLFFDRFAPGTRTPTGLLYFGNTPSLSVTRSATTLDHFDSDSGIKQKDDSVDIQTDANGKFTCDNINGANLALFFGGVATQITQAASGGTALTETVSVLPDHFYQLGVTPSDPDGARNVNTFTATIGGSTPLVDGTDYVLDASAGLVHILPSTAVASGGSVAFGYKLVAAAQEQVVEQGSAIYGQLKFVSNNPKGDQRDYFFPYVKLSASGDFALKGDTWQQVEFNFDALKLNDVTQRIYITKRPLS